MKSRLLSSRYILLFLVLIVAGLVKLILMITNSVPFNADEAVVGLMARHILAGERPIFYWGQAYMGSLDAYLIAIGFLLFGAQVWVIRLVQTILFLGTVWTTVLLGARIYGSYTTGLLAGLLVAIPSVNVILYTTASLGGYGEALLIGNFILLSSLKLGQLYQSQQETLSPSRVQKSVFLWLGIFCFLTGLGLWTLGLTVVYSLPAGIYLIIVFYKHGLLRKATTIVALLSLGLISFIIGSLPWWIYAIQHGFHALIGELFGGAVYEPGQIYLRWLIHLINLIILGFPAILGIRPPWDVRWLALPLAPFALAFWIGAIIKASRWFQKNNGEPSGVGLLWGISLALIAGFVFTPFGKDPSGRYFLPFGIILALFGANFLQSVPISVRTWKYPILILVLIFNFTGIVQCIVRNPPGITTQFNPESLVDHRYDRELVNFLQEQGETRGYTTYWVSYPLAFLTDEKIIYLPQLPYYQSLQYTTRDDRYAPYRKVVADSTKVAYITVNQFQLDEILREGFRGAGITWEEHKIGGYQVFYRLSELIQPGEITNLYSNN